MSAEHLHPQERRIHEKTTVQEEIERFGDKLWRGPAIEVAEQSKSLFINAGETQDVEFRIKPASNLPFGGNISLEVLLRLYENMRSRYAHVGLDVVNVAQHIYDAFRRAGLEKFDRSFNAPIPVINHCERPLELEPNARLFHMYYYTEAAYIRGDELEDIVGNEEDKPVYIKGKEGDDWIIKRETTPNGDLQAIGIFVKIDPNERFWIPPSDDPIKLSGEGSFREVREYLFENVFKKYDDPNFPMPKNALWIGKGPHMKLDSGIYAEIDHNVCIVNGDKYDIVGMQTQSPLLEGERTNHQPHFELKAEIEKGEICYASLKIIRNGQPAEQG